MANVGDLNADGHDDLAVHSGFFSGSTSISYYSGIDGSAIGTPVSNGFGSDGYGTTILAVGDINGDLVDDHIVGVSFNDTAATNGGALTLVSGADQTTLLWGPVYGSEVDMNLGSPLSTRLIPDINGDGVQDILHGNSESDNIGFAFPEGAVHIFFGTDGSALHTIRGTRDGQGLGGAAALTCQAIADINGDSTPDFAFGDYSYSSASFTDCGRILFYSGSDGSLINTIEGTFDEQQLGSSLISPGDLNSDGLADIVTTALNGPAPIVYQLLALDPQSGSTIWSQPYGFPNEDIPYSTRGWIEDVNADGVNDIITYGFQFDYTAGDQTGGLYVLSGLNGEIIWSALADNPDSWTGYFGQRLIPDQNGDGLTDILVATVSSDGSDDSFGVISGTDGSWLMKQDSQAENLGLASPLFGDLLINLGDLDGDGLLDFGISASIADASSVPFAGSIWVYTGALPTP